MDFNTVYNTVQSLDNLAIRQAYKWGQSLNREDIEDILQQSLLSAWEKLDQFDSTKASLSTWLGWIVRGRTLNFIKKKKGCSLEVESESEETPQDVAQASDTIEKLNDQQLYILGLVGNGVTNREIATMDNTSEVTVRRKIKRIKQWMNGFDN